MSLVRYLMLCLFAGLLSAGGCNQGDPKLIKIVSSLPRTGSARAQTDTIVNGIKMALEEAGMKVGEFTIAYEDLDDATAAQGQWTAEAESANARRAARDPDVMVYIGTYNSGAAKISMPILNRAGLLMISPANTAVELTKPNPQKPEELASYRPTGKVTYTRVVPADDLQGPMAAGWAQKMGMKTVFVLDDREVYGRGIALLFAEECENLGIEVLGHESIDAKASEFKSLMTNIRQLDPDLIYFGGTTQSKGGQIAKDIVASGMRAQLMAPDGCREDAFIESAGADNLNERCYITFGGIPPDKMTGAGAVFVKKYQAKYGNLPEAYAVYGYEAAQAALEAIRRAGKKDRQAIVDACLAIKGFEGALGTWSFDENGDTTLKAMSGSIVRDGKFVTIEVLGQEEDMADAADADGLNSEVDAAAETNADDSEAPAGGP